MLASATPVFDFTVNLGNLITIGVCLASVAFLVSGLKTRQEAQSERLGDIDDRLGAVDKKLDKIVDLQLSYVAVEGRLNVMDERIAAQGRRVDNTMSRLNMVLDGEYHRSGKTGA